MCVSLTVYVTGCVTVFNVCTVCRVLAPVVGSHPVQLLLCVPPPAGQAARPAAAEADRHQPAGLPWGYRVPGLHVGSE